MFESHKPEHVADVPWCLTCTEVVPSVIVPTPTGQAGGKSEAERDRIFDPQRGGELSREALQLSFGGPDAIEAFAAMVLGERPFDPSDDAARLARMAREISRDR